VNRIDQAHLGISEGTVDVINAQLVFSISDTNVDIVGIKNKNVQLLNYNNTFHITANNWTLVLNNATCKQGINVFNRTWSLTVSLSRLELITNLLNPQEW